MHSQRSLDVDAAHEVDVHVRVFVDAFFAGRPSEACWCEALDKKKQKKESAFCQNISNSLTAVSVYDSCLHSKIKRALYEFI